MSFARRFAIQMALAIFLAHSLGLCAGAPMLRSTPTVSYFREVRPIFQAHCQGCHQPAKASGGYVMTNFDNLARGVKEARRGGRQAGRRAPSSSRSRRRRQGGDAQGQAPLAEDE